MTIEPLPLIAERDYQAIREIIADLPPTYAGWQSLHEREKRQRGEIGKLQEVRVLPEPLRAFCQQRNRYDLNMLLLYAIENADRGARADQEYDPDENHSD